jgi:hypothetical protein
MQDWDEEAEEDEAIAEEELIRVQQEIERLRQEQESIMRRQAIMQHANAHRQHINRERVRLTELQYTIDILHQQEQRQEPPLCQWQHQPNDNPPPPHNHIPPPPLPFNTIHHHQPLSLPHNFQPPHHPRHNSAPQIPRAHSPAIYNSHHGLSTTEPHPNKNADPRKFLMCYKADIASIEGDKATLTKSLIIPLEDAVANWYSRLRSGCIHSW